MTPKFDVGKNFVIGNSADGYKLQTVTEIYKGTDGTFFYRFQHGNGLTPQDELEKWEPVQFVKG